jgi:hypothetical protein
LGYFNREYNIPVTEEYHRGHKAITSNGYKSDPRGYSVKRLIDLYAARIPQIPSISFDTFYTYGDMQPRAVYNALIAAGKDPGLEICNGDIAQLKLLQKFEAELPTDTTHIYPPLKDYWEASGGLWQSDRYALGYAKVRPKRNADGTIEQVFERGILELYPDGTIQGRLLY